MLGLFNRWSHRRFRDLLSLYIDRRLDEIERIARRVGYSVAVGHAYPVTVERLTIWIKSLEEKQISLVPVSALANRQKDPLFLFSALQRQLDYPEVPQPKPIDNAPLQIAQMSRRLEQLAQRLKLVEEEQRTGIDLSRFYGRSEEIPPTE